LIGFVKSISWFEFSLRASKNLHQTCLWGVLRSPLQFFVANPTGRILNRFSKDQNVVDESFPLTTFDFLQCAAFCASAVIVVCISIPYVTIILVPLIFAFVYLRSNYLKSSREVKRIESTTRSPIYADFSSILEGITTVRAYKIDKTVTTMFRRQVDDNSKSWFTFVILNRWLGFRLDIETFFVLLAAIYPAVALKGTIDVGLLGFALVYVLNLSSLFQWTVRMSTEVENQMTSVERIQAYSKLPPEEGYALKSFLDRDRPRAANGSGPAEGAPTRPDRARTLSSEVASKYLKLGQSAPAEENVPTLELAGKTQDVASLFKLEHLFVTYREDLDPVIKDLSLSIPAGSKLGICGRTGSGKSSLLLALLRLNIIESGDIVFDGKSLLSMSLEEARSLVSVIPQEPHLFSGTIRSNLDPFHRYSDAEIWEALENAHIKDYISRDPLGLQAPVSESGSNFSIGQRQLLSLSRAILRRCPIVLMDEVTASIDYQTDRLIQLTIRTSPALKTATIITIAHRLRTIADSDYIAVISAGVLSEFGAPSELITKQGSLFKSLAEETNEYQDIYSIISSHAQTTVK
jgi:ATP-binding cassette subfamily C (CFTR/MRP) protein 4